MIADTHFGRDKASRYLASVLQRIIKTDEKQGKRVAAKCMSYVSNARYWALKIALLDSSSVHGTGAWSKRDVLSVMNVHNEAMSLKNNDLMNRAEEFSEHIREDVRLAFQLAANLAVTATRQYADAKKKHRVLELKLSKQLVVALENVNSPAIKEIVSEKINSLRRGR